jgi:hypothetical protein
MTINYQFGDADAQGSKVQTGGSYTAFTDSAIGTSSA